MTDTKPIIQTFNPLTPLTSQKYERYLPTAYDDSLTMLEKVDKVLDSQNVVVNTVNDALTQMNEVETWVLGDGLQQDVNTKLDAMKDDGSLENLINKEILGDVSTLTTNDKSSIVAAVNEVDAQLAKTRLYANVKKFGAKGDGVTDDSQAFISAINYANDNNTTIYIPNGVYLIGQTIDLTNLPQNVIVGAEDYSYRLIFEGESVAKTFLIGAVGIKKLFTYTPSDKTKTRSFTFKKMKIRSKEPYEDLNTRADLICFELLASPYTQFEDIDFLGISDGFHMQNCYFSTFKKITGSRVSRGIFIDGTSPDGTSYGYADFIYLDQIHIGGWSTDYAIKMLGSKASKITNFDSEAGQSGDGIILQGCHNIEIDTFYFENYIDGVPFNISGNPALNSITDFCTNIKIKNGHIYNLQTTFMYFTKGVDDVEVEKCRFLFNYDVANPLTNQRMGLYGFSEPIGPNFGNWFKNLSVMKNEYYAPDNYQNVFLEGYSTAFVEDGVMYLNTTNISYYTPTFKKGIIVRQLKDDQNYTQIFVEETGSYGTLTSITGTTTSGSNVVQLNSVTELVVGTFIDIGQTKHVKVLNKDPNTNKIVIGKNASVSESNVAVTYSPPTLRYTYKSLYGTTASRPTNLVAGQTYFDSTLQKPIWWTGSAWKDATGATV